MRSHNNLCRLDTTHHYPAATAAGIVVDTMVAEVGTTDNTDHTKAEHNQ
ncbi:hypothetical protein Tco_0605148, partial [Tanacetum coccineum]